MTGVKLSPGIKMSLLFSVSGGEYRHVERLTGPGKGMVVRNDDLQWQGAKTDMDAPV